MGEVTADSEMMKLFVIDVINIFHRCIRRRVDNDESFIGLLHSKDDEQRHLGI